MRGGLIVTQFFREFVQDFGAGFGHQNQILYADAGQVTAAAATDADGRYYAVCAFDERDLPEPGSACAGSNTFRHFTREMCAWDGHRLAILDYGYWLPDHGMRYRYYSRLSVYEDGELVFCEWLPALLRQQPFAERALTLSAEPREVTP